MPHLNYSLLACGNKCSKIELLQKKAVRLVNFKTPIAHTQPLFKQLKQVKLSDLYTCHLLKLYYKLYRNRLPSYFDSFLYWIAGLRPEFGNDLIFDYLLSGVNLAQ